MTTPTARFSIKVNDKTKASFSKIETRLARIRSSVLNVTSALGGLSAVAGVAAMVRTFGQFEEGMSGVLAVSGATTKQFKEMSQQAKILGATTRFTATEAASGMEFLARAGFKANEVIAAMPGMLDLAAAGKLELGKAADITSNIMSGFGIAVEKTNAVVDTLAITAASSNTNIEQLGEAMQVVGPVASSLGLSLNDVSAAVGTLGNAGLQGAEAGTGLQRVLINLINTTPVAEKAIRGMGLSLEEVNPEANSLIDIFEKMRAANLSAGEAYEIFGARGGKFALALTKQIDVLKELTETTNNAEGAAREMALIMEDNLPGAFRSFRSAVDGVMIRLGSGGLSDALKELLFNATGVLRVFAGMEDSLGDNREKFISMANTIKGVGAAFAALIALRIPVYLLSTAKAIAAISLALVTNPFTLAAVSIGAMVGVMVGLRDETVRLKDETFSLGTVTQATYETLLDKAISFSQDFTAIFAGLPSAMGTVADGLGTSFFDAITSSFDNLIALAKLTFNKIYAVAKSAVDILANPFQELADGGAPNLLETIQNNFTTDWIGKLINDIKEGFGILTIEIKDAANDIHFEDVIKPQIESVADSFINSIYGSVNPALDSMQDELDQTSTRTNTLSDSATKFLDRLEEQGRLLQFTGKELAVQTALGQAHSLQIKGQDDAIRELVESNYDLQEAQEAASKAAEASVQIFRDTATSIRSTFRDSIRGILDDGVPDFESFADKILNIFKDMLADMATLALAKPVIVPIVQAVGGGLGISQSVQGAVLGNLGITDALSGVSAASRVGGWLGFGGAASSTAWLGSSAGASLSAAAPTFYGTSASLAPAGATFYGAPVSLAAGASGAAGTGAAAGASGSVGAGGSSFLGSIPGWGWAAMAALALFGLSGSKPSNRTQSSIFDVDTGGLSNFWSPDSDFSTSKFGQKNFDNAQLLATIGGQLTQALSLVTGQAGPGNFAATVGSVRGVQYGFGQADPSSGNPSQFAIGGSASSPAEAIAGIVSLVTEQFSEIPDSLQEMLDTFDFTAPESLVAFMEEAERIVTLPQRLADFNQGVQDEILRLTDPFQYELDQFARYASERIRVATELGLTDEQMTELLRLTGIERQQIIDKYTTEEIEAVEEVAEAVGVAADATVEAAARIREALGNIHSSIKDQIRGFGLEGKELEQFNLKLWFRDQLNKVYETSSNPLATFPLVRDLKELFSLRWNAIDEKYLEAAQETLPAINAFRGIAPTVGSFGGAANDGFVPLTGIRNYLETMGLGNGSTLNPRQRLDAAIALLKESDAGNFVSRAQALASEGLSFTGGGSGQLEIIQLIRAHGNKLLTDNGEVISNPIVEQSKENTRSLLTASAHQADLIKELTAEIKILREQIRKNEEKMDRQLVGSVA